MFLAFARSEIERYAGLPRLADEARRLRQLFDAAEQDGHCRLLLRENATLDDVLDVFQDTRYHGRIAPFHFAGHGDEYSLLLENASRRRRPSSWAGSRNCSNCEEIRRARLPVLLLLTYDYPQPLTRPDPEDKPADALAWLRRLCNAPLYYARSLFVPRLTPGEIELLLEPQSAEAAVELYSLSEGIPAIIEGLLAHWAATGAAEQGEDGRWRLARTFGFAVPGRLYDELVTQSLEEGAARAQALGYPLEAGDLLAWLNHAAWEGEVFTDEALARAVGWYDGAYDPFEEVLDEALCGDLDDGDALVSQVDYLELPSGDGGTRFLTRYIFNPPLVGHVLRQRQDAAERLKAGRAYTIWDELQQALEHYEHALSLFRQVGDKNGEAGALRSISLVYTGLGQPQRALACCEQALALRRQTSAKGGEAWVLTELGLIYAGLGEPQRALAYCEQALPLMRQAGDRSGEARTFRCMGVVRAAGDLTAAEGHITLAVELDGQYGHPQLARDRALLAEMQEQRRAQEG